MLHRFLAISVAALVAGSSLSAFAAEQVLDGIAAVVNKDVITFSQVRELVGPREQMIRDNVQGPEQAKLVRDLRLAAVQELIDRQLVLQEFEKNKFSIPDHILEDHIRTIIREQFNNDRAAFIRTLQAQGYSIQRFRKLESDKMIVQAMRQRSVKVSPIISPDQVRSYYNRNLSQYSSKEEIKLRMIVLRSDNPEAKNIAEELRRKVVAGEDFAKVAALYSEDSSKDSGGDWGWIDRSTLNERLTEAAFNVRTGQVSRPIEISGNYYLLYVEARKNAIAKPLAEVRDEIEQRVLQEERANAQKKWVEGLRKKAYVKVY